MPLGGIKRSKIHDDEIETLLRNFDEALDCREGSMLPVFEMGGAGEDLQAAFVRGQKPTEQRGIEAIEVLHRVTQLERRLQVEQCGNVSHGPRKVEQHRGFAGDLSQLHREVHRDSAGSNAALCSQNNK